MHTYSGTIVVNRTNFTYRNTQGILNAHFNHIHLSTVHSSGIQGSAPQQACCKTMIVLPWNNFISKYEHYSLLT